MTLRNRMMFLIRREMERASRGRLVFKMNALEDKAMVKLLYEASRAGVKIDLIVRGLCCLRPGIPGVSENITVRSIVGRFLNTAGSTISKTAATRKSTRAARGPDAAQSRPSR